MQHFLWLSIHYLLLKTLVANLARYANVNFCLEVSADCCYSPRSRLRATRVVRPVAAMRKRTVVGHEVCRARLARSNLRVAGERSRLCVATSRSREAAMPDDARVLIRGRVVVGSRCWMVRECSRPAPPRIGCTSGMPHLPSSLDKKHKKNASISPSFKYWLFKFFLNFLMNLCFVLNFFI